MIVGWNISFELDLLTFGLLMVLMCSDTITLTWMNEMALLVLTGLWDLSLL